MMCLHRCRAAAQQIIRDCLSMGEMDDASTANAEGCNRCDRAKAEDLRPASGTLGNDGGASERRIWISTEDSPDC